MNQYRISDDEYRMIKEEIGYWQNEENKYWVFTYTAVGAIVSLALQQSNPLILMGCYFILLPAMSQLYHVKTNYIFLGIYLSKSVSSSYKWETISNKFKCNKSKYKLLNNVLMKVRNLSLNFISIAILLLYIYIKIYELKNWMHYDYFIVSFSFVLIICLFFLCIKYNDEGKIRNDIDNSWEETIQNFLKEEKM